MAAYVSWLWRGNVGSDGLFHVPYDFSPSATFPADQIATIESALQDLSDTVGILNIRKKVSSDTEYITITSGSGCWSYIGRVPSYAAVGQELNLQPNVNGWGCVHKGIVQHEMMHALGIFHEQSRPDRDDFVTINFGNIQSGYEGNFEKSSDILSRGSAYDYGSVMHYDEYAFSTSPNVLKTIDAGGASVGQRDGASDTDLVQIRLMYQCEDRINDMTSYTASPCAADCKCSIGMAGCNGNDNFCHGSAVCLNNQCSASGGAMHCACLHAIRRCDLIELQSTCVSAATTVPHPWHADRVRLNTTAAPWFSFIWPLHFCKASPCFRRLPRSPGCHNRSDNYFGAYSGTNHRITYFGAYSGTYPGSD